MKIKLNKSWGIMPVVSDPTKRLAEAQDTDHVQLMGFGISYVDRIANFSLVPGSYDSQGKFHEGHKAPVANLSINGNSPTERELFDDLFLDNKGNPKFKFDDAFVKRLLKDEGFLELANERVWGFEEVDIDIDGELAFQRRRPTTE